MTLVIDTMMGVVLVTKCIHRKRHFTSYTILPLVLKLHVKVHEDAMWVMKCLKQDWLTVLQTLHS